MTGLQPTGKAIEILLVEDDPGDARLLREMLTESGARFELMHVERLSQALRHLGDTRFDVIVLDLGLPDSQGLRTLEQVCAQAPDAPVVVLTGLQDEAVTLKAVQRGAQDYLVKGQFESDRLGRALRYAVERKQAEAALRQSEARYRSLFDNSINGVALHEIVTDAEGRPVDYVFLEVNRAFEQLTGVSAEQAMGRRVTEVLPGIEKDPFIEIYGRVALTGEPTRFEQFATPLKRIYDITAFSPRRGQFAVTFTDITERKRTEEALRRSEEYFRALIENASDVITVLDSAGIIHYESPSVERVLGYKPEELVGKNAFELVHPDDFPGVVDVFARVVSTVGVSAAAEMRYRHKDGSWRVVEVIGKSMVDETGQWAGVINSRDVTERKRAEEALRESEERYRSLFENMLEGFAYCKMLYEDDQPQDFLYLDVNTAFETLTGLKNVIGKKVTEVIPGIRESSPELFEIYGRVALTGQPERFETYLETLGIWFSISVYSTRKEHFVAVFDNITERKQAEAALAARNEEIKAMSQQLWQAAKLATMGELAASIAHELNNPLATVSLRAESLLAQVPADDPKRRSLEVVEQEVERMGMLVANLLQFSRRSAPQVSTVDVREEIVKTLELIHYHLRQRQIAVAQAFAPDVPLLQADRQQLRQLFLNLFTNAGDAMPQGGTLTIRVYVQKAESGRQKAEAVLALPSADRLLPSVCIEVADTGMGIPPADLPKVTKPFFTTKPEGKGTGLGLAICRRVVQEHSGTLDITSEGLPGKGTTVRIALPVSNGINVAHLKV